MNATPSISELQLFDHDLVQQSLEVLLPPGQVTELRILDCITHIDRWPHTAFGYFDNPRKLAASLAAVKAAKGIYVIPNPVNPALLARAANRIRKAGKGEATSDRDILSRRWLLIDTDAVRPEGISATDDEHGLALERARSIYTELHFNYGWPEPIAADSSNGGHLLYRVDLPANDGGLVQRCLAALAAKFDDDTVVVDQKVFNPARIWKLYGCRSCKGDSVADRPHRLSQILRLPELLVPVTSVQLEEPASEAPSVASAAAPQQQNGNGTFDIDTFIQQHQFELDGPDAYQGGRKWTFRNSPLCEHHGDGPFLIQFANGALSAGCHHNSCGWTWHDLRDRFGGKPDAGLYERLLNKAASNGSASTPPPAAPRAIEYTRITSAELASGNYDLEFAIEGAMVARQPLTIGGPMKVLKTSFLIDAAVSLSIAGHFLGLFKVHRPWRVAVMSGESGLSTLQETANRVCSAAGVQLADCGNLIWSPDIPKFADARHLNALERFLGGDGIEVLFLDPAYLAMPSADAGNLMAQGELLRNMNDVCGKLGVTMVLCHHTKRHTGQDPFAPLELQHLSWSGFAEHCRQWWLVNRRERYEPGTGKHKLWLSIGGSAGHSSLWAVDVAEGLRTDPGGRKWEVSLTDAAGARQAAAEQQQSAKQQDASKRIEADRKAICEALAAVSGYIETKRELRESTCLNSTRFNAAFASLMRDKSIVKTTIKKSNGQTYDAYTFAKSDG